MTRKVNLADVVGPLNAADFSGKSKARAALGLENVDNTADMDKPVSRATQAELDTKAPLDSPAFTGKPTGIDKSHVGLGNVDNTSDAEKPISAATRKALDGKAEADHTHDFSDALASLATLGEAKQQDTRIALGVPAKHFDTVGQLIADKTVWPEGARLTAGDAGYVYRVAGMGAGDHQLVTAGGTKLYVVADRITPDQFGADPSGKEDSTEAFNAAMQFCVKTSKSGYSSGLYRMSGTLTPGGRYVWDWGNTRLMWGNVSTTSLTEAYYNPNGSSVAQPSGKYVLFDTVNCTASSNVGSLTILGVSPGNMQLANRSKINPNVIAITASKNSSADMTWGTLIITGCGYGLLQGDQRGTAFPNILPYTRWQINYLRIQLCLVAMECGFGGNGFDDMVLNELRITQCAGRSTIRNSDMGGGVAFINGLAPGQDEEAQTITTIAGSTSATLSADNAGIVVGTVLVIDKAGSNKAGEPKYLTTRVVSKSGTSVTLERPADLSSANAHIFCNPPELLLQVSSWRFQQTYLEEIHAIPMRLFNRSAIYGVVKASGGDVSSLYDCGLLLQSDSTVDISLHDKSANNNQLKALVGVGSMRNGTDYCSNRVHLIVPGTYKYATTKSDPLRIVKLLPAEYPAGYTIEASSENNPSLDLSAAFTDGTRVFQQCGAGSAVAFRTGSAGHLELNAPQILSSTAYEGKLSDASKGSSEKTRGGFGALIHRIQAAKTYRVSLSISAGTAIAPSLQWYLDGKRVVNIGVVARTIGRHVIFVTVPEKGVNQLALCASDNEEFTLTEFSVAEVLSI